MYFLYVGDDERSNHLAEKDKNSSATLSWLSSLQTFFVAFNVLWTYSVQKLSQFVRSKYFFLNCQDGGENCSADQVRKAAAFISHQSKNKD